MPRSYPEFLSHPVFKVIAETAEQLGMDAYAVGGYVRDQLIGRECKDIDIVAVGSGIVLAQAVARHEGKDLPVTVFKNFGTAMLQWGDLQVEFVGARKESYNRDSRKPIVEDGTLEDDQKRRDFTINAMSLSLQARNFGELIDPFNGYKDLEELLIRTPVDPDITFSDDPLRMMRAIRFASQLGFDIEAKAYDSISKNVERIDIISKERIAEELNKIILSPVPSIGFEMLFDTKLLERIFPDMVKLQGVDIVHGKGHKDNFYHTLQVLDNICRKTDNLWLRWAAILHDIAKPATKRFDPKQGWTFHGHEDKGARMVPDIFRSLKLPLDSKMKFVQKLVRLHLRPIALSKDVVTDTGVRRLLFDAGEDIEDLMTLAEADITSKNERKVERYLSNFQIVRQKLKDVEERDRVREFQPPVTGEMIMEAFSIQPCKAIGDIKNAIKEAILAGEIGNDPDEAYLYMLKIGEEMGLLVTGGG